MNNFKLHFGLNGTLLFLDLACPELQEHKNQDIRNMAGRWLISQKALRALTLAAQLSAKLS